MPQQLFTTSSSFSMNNLLKYIYSNNLVNLWATVDDSFDAVIQKETDFVFGKNNQYALTVDAGGGAFGGMDQVSGGFVPGHKVTNTTGSFVQKLQTFTLQWENFMDLISGEQAAAYINNRRQEIDQKLKFQKNFMLLQALGDGTGRQGTPIAFVNGIAGSSGVADVTSGATFTVADNWTPIGIRLSSLSGAVGSASYFLEGSVISFVYSDRDLDNNGTNEVTEANGRVRLLTLQCVDSVSAGNYKWDAFKVVEVDQRRDIIYVLPVRLHSGVAGITNVTKTWYENDPVNAQWVPGGSGTVTVTPLRGTSVSSDADSVYAGAVADFNLIFGAVTPTLIHPNYINNTQATAKTQLGIGWTASTDLGTISANVLTGIDALLYNRTNTVHGLQRSVLRQLLPTNVDLSNTELTFQQLFNFITDHVNRNRGKIPEWNSLLINAVGYSSMINQGELDRRITESKGIRGEENAHMIVYGGKRFQFEPSSCMRKDKVAAIGKNALKLKDGKVRPVTAGNQTEFLTLSSGSRVNVTESYNTVRAEMTVEELRACAVMSNFKVSM